MPTLRGINDKVLSPQPFQEVVAIDSEEGQIKEVDGLGLGNVFKFEPLNEGSVESQSADSTDLTASSSALSSSSSSSSSSRSASEQVPSISENTQTPTDSCHHNEDEQVCKDETKQPLDCVSFEDNSILDDEIRARLDKLNALSDLINSLELQFDQANRLFREILKCSTFRLSILAKKLGSSSLNHGRNYHAARISVEQTQTDCQKACIQFEQANNDHQFAKEAIREAEHKLREITASSPTHLEPPYLCKSDSTTPDLARLSLNGIIEETKEYSEGTRDQKENSTSDNDPLRPDHSRSEKVSHLTLGPDEDERLRDAARLSEMLNTATIRLREAEQKRAQSERLHLDKANKLMIAQENLQRLEREHGNSIKRSQLYFDESNRFKAQLNSVKSDISRISDEIAQAKKAYSRTLGELEKFSEELHFSSAQAKQRLLKQKCDNSNEPLTLDVNKETT